MRALFIVDVRSRELYPSVALWGEQVSPSAAPSTCANTEIFVEGLLLRGAGRS